MPVEPVAASVVYSICAFVTWGRCTALYAWYLAGRGASPWCRSCHLRRADGLLSGPSGEQWLWAAFVGVLAAAAWPVVVMTFAVRGRLLAPPRDVQLRRLQRRNDELERELEDGR